MPSQFDWQAAPQQQQDRETLVATSGRSFVRNRISQPPTHSKRVCPSNPGIKLSRPREDLREGKPLDASEFAVHLDQVREGHAPADYQKPERFFERTYLTKNLWPSPPKSSGGCPARKTETNAIFNLATQFGGGKTHALTLLYHLARQGPAAEQMGGRATHPRQGWRASGAQGRRRRFRRHRVRFHQRARRQRRHAAAQNALGRNRVAAWRREGIRHRGRA